MFKKTLLALAAAGMSASATAGILTVDVVEGANTQNSADVTAIGGAAVDGCAQAATILGVTATADAGVTPDSKAGADTINDTTGAATSVYSSKASSVNYTGADACDVYIADELVDADDAKYSQEGAEALGLTISAKQIAGVGGLQKEDTIIFTVEGGTVNESASLGATLTGTGGPGDFTLLGVVGNQILFTVNAVQPARQIVDIDGVVVTPTAGTDAISISSVVQNTANVQYDKSDLAEITKIAKQYSATTDVAADGIIDVATERFDFAANSQDSSDTVLGLNDKGEAITNDTLVIMNTENTTQGNLTPATGEIVITGNFSWMMDLDANDDGELSATELEAGFDFNPHKTKVAAPAPNAGELAGDGDDTLTAGKTALNETMTELTLQVTSGADNDIDKYHAITFTVPGTAGEAAVSLQPTDFLATVNFVNDKATDGTTSDVDLNVTTDLDVGEWTLNGSVVEVPYIPFGPKTQPIIRHTNTGAQTGDISVRYMVEEGSGLAQTNEWKSLGILVEDAKPGVRNLLTVITDALEAELGQEKFKVALEITTNVPAEDVTVYAAAKVDTTDTDRLTIGAFKGEQN